jgi:FkbM family methyltransferase
MYDNKSMNRDHLDFLKVYQFDSKLRLGLQTDGGYVIADISGGYDCYISAGVGREESFTRDFLSKYSMNEFNTFGIDASIDEYPSEYTNNISFIKKNISDTNTLSTTNLSPLIQNFNDIFLKIDVEGAEYPWIQSLTLEKLSKFKQIVIECHGINNDSWGYPYDMKKDCLEKLSKTHYLVHAHGNNSRGTTHYIPNIVELTYIRKDVLSEKPPLNITPLPIKGLDYPNNKNRPDHAMNIYPFMTC